MYKKNISVGAEILIRRVALNVILMIVIVNNSLESANVRTSVQFCKRKIAKKEIK